jgi:arsenite methyltransferase
MKSEKILQVVKGRYDKAAEVSGAATGSCCCPSAAPASPGFAAQHGLYTPADLASVPKIAVNLSRGCGNPMSFAGLRPGEVVVDFGCGGGMDVILAARQVTPGGKVIGVDFAPHMIERAKKAVAEASLSGSVELVSGDLAQSHLPDESADVVISNCVINLCPDKVAVYREAFRILKPGGRLAISDIEYSENPAPEVKSRFEATWAGCVGGSMEEQAYLDLIGKAGFEEIHIVARHPLGPSELEEMACCPGPEFTPRPEKEDLAAVQGKVTSIKFNAVKPLSHQ